MSITVLDEVAVKGAEDEGTGVVLEVDELSTVSMGDETYTGMAYVAFTDMVAWLPLDVLVIKEVI